MSNQKFSPYSKVIALLSLSLACSAPLLEAQQSANPGTQSSDVDMLLRSSRTRSQHDARWDLGDTALRTRHFDYAITTFRQILDGVDKQSVTAGQLHWRIGECYRRKGDWDASISELQQAKKLMPGDPVTPVTLALVLEKKGRRADAAAEWSSAQQLASKEQVQKIKQFLLSVDGRQAVK